MLQKKLFGNDEICEFSTESWWQTYKQCEESLPKEEWNEILDIIHKNKFDDELTVNSDLGNKLIAFYSRNRKSMVESDSDLFRIKQEYDANPIIKNKILGRKN